MDNKKTQASGGISFLGVLTILFIALKLLGKITWSWVWVLAPIWIPSLVAVVALLIFVLVIKRKTKGL